MLRYRLGLDMGSSSLGWCVIQLDKDDNPIGLLDWGARIFDDGREPAKKDVPGESSAVQRRAARGMRRRYDRKLMRKKAVLRALVKHGLLPADTTEQQKLKPLNPLKLRAEALERKLEPHEIGRALFHLQQRRGFKSNRKDAQKDGDNKIDGMKLGIRELENALGNDTLGQFLYGLHQKRNSTRFRPQIEKNKAKYSYYPNRKMVGDEFNAIWEAQAKYHPALLTEEARKAVHNAIFYQRKLKAPEVGKCTLVPTDKRMAWAMPSAQAFRIIKEVNNLAIISPDANEPPQKLNQEQRRKVYDALRSQGSLTFKTGVRKLVGVSSECTFNLAATREKLLGDRTAEILRHETRFGERWDSFSLAEQDAIVAKLLDDDIEDETLVAWLVQEYQLTPEQAEKIAEANLPSAHARFGATVINTILPRMRDEGMLEHEAIAAGGWHHSHHYTGEICDTLPYYGEKLEQHVVPMKSSDPLVKKHGRINNPTVHIALNQLRRLMNTLKKRYGTWPEGISLEMARELKKGRTEIAEIIREIDKNTKKREEWKKEIEKYKAEAKAEDYAKMKLWEELAKDPMHRKCVYTGETISIEMLFNGQTQIDHILPYSQTLDNTSANLILVTVEGNQVKKNRTPHEAFKNESGRFAYDAVWERAQGLPSSKKWRFRTDAMDIFDSKAKTIEMKSSLDGSAETIETGLESFAARQLNDTSYMAKLAKKYLAYACNNGEKGVAATSGQLTGLLRKSWGLNSLLGEDGEKNRNDHRHHAVDALVIAMTTRSMVKSVADAAKKEEETGTRLVQHIQKPWSDFDVAQLKERVNEITVSHKPDHGTPAQSTGGTSGRLHEDTYYGYVGEGKKKGNIQLVVRVAMDSFDKLEHLDDIRDKTLRQKVKDFVDTNAARNEKGEISKDALKKALSDFSKQTGVNRVRTLVEKSRDVMVNPKKTSYKWMQGGSNQRAEIYCPKSGKKAGKWQMEVIKTFDANRAGFIPKWRQEHPDAELVMTLHSNDMVAYEENEKTEIRRVQKMNSNGRTYFVPHTIAKNEKDKYSRDFSSAEAMQQRKLRRIYVEIDGSIYDPHGVLTSHPKKESAA